MPITAPTNNGKLTPRIRVPAPRRPRPPIEIVLARLNNATPSSAVGQWTAQCPCCDHGSSRHLTITEAKDGKVLLHCHHARGCKLDDILEELGLETRHLFPDSFVDERDQLLAMSGPAERRPAQPPPRIAQETQNREAWERMSDGFQKELPPDRLESLAGQLGIQSQFLVALGIGWFADHLAYTWPERDADGAIIGISLRYAANGKKSMIKGSRRGLYLPPDWQVVEGAVFIVEGPTDTAAMLELGLCAIGRPSATGGVELLGQLLSRVADDRAIVVMGEYDAKADGSWPGRDGAVQLAQQLADVLGRKVAWALPTDGAKDVRAWLQRQNNQ